MSSFHDLGHGSQKLHHRAGLTFIGPLKPIRLCYPCIRIVEHSSYLGLVNGMWNVECILYCGYYSVILLFILFSLSVAAFPFQFLKCG